nr:hypothetical protein [Rhodococcus sp. (in: high G+C Gram-positive bacteria)]
MNIVLDRPEVHLPQAALPDWEIESVEPQEAANEHIWKLHYNHGGFHKVTFVNGQIDYFYGDDMKVADLMARVAA